MLSLITPLLLVCATNALLFNVTVDDYFGDPTGGLVEVYRGIASLGDVPVSANCSEINCSIQPNVSLAYNGTWSTVIYDAEPGATANITLYFQGVSIWVFFILANNVNNGTSFLATAQCNFTLDGNDMGTFSHQPNASTNALQYNASVFSVTNLQNSPHELVISANPNSNASYITFDYAIYTVEIPDNTTLNSPSSSTPTSSSASVTVVTGASSTNTRGSAEVHRLSLNSKLGTIIGSLVGVASTLALVTLLFRHRGRKQLIVPPIAFTQPPHSNSDDVAMSNARLPCEFPTQLVPVRQEYQNQHTPITKSRDEFRAERQREIDQRLQVAHRKIHNLTRRQDSLRVSRPDLPFPSAEVTETEEELDAMREQMRQLWAQIEQLEMERSSNWAQGLSNEPPPEYY
ncbi:hypothetical protein F5887DRAFT_922113 [Amanita rubescens]|nr:hypothetical protein F5887DRAFT_922113 [Amanita rubescens]